MKFAVINGPVKRDAHVENVIVASADQKAELESALGKTLLDAGPLGLTVGDLYNGKNWTRNVDGEQMALPIVPGTLG